MSGKSKKIAHFFSDSKFANSVESLVCLYILSHSGLLRIFDLQDPSHAIKQTYFKEQKRGLCQPIQLFICRVLSSFVRQTKNDWS